MIVASPDPCHIGEIEQEMTESERPTACFHVTRPVPGRPRFWITERRRGRQDARTSRSLDCIAVDNPDTLALCEPGSDAAPCGLYYYAMPCHAVPRLPGLTRRSFDSQELVQPCSVISLVHAAGR